MKVRCFFICLLWCAAIGWLALCFYLSSQSLDDTGRLSISMTRFIIKTLNLPDNVFMMVHDGLRTLAHVVVFFVLALFVSGASDVTFQNFRKFPLWSFLLCFIISVADEVHKVFIPGRHCSFFEMGLNVFGCLMGTWTIYLILLKKRKTSASRKHGCGTGENSGGHL